MNGRTRFRALLAAGAIAVAATATVAVSGRTVDADTQKALNAAYAKYKGLQEGKNADYIPVLAKVDPNIFGIALVTTDGRVFTAGDVKSEVSIQSIAKVFTMARVIQDRGPEIVRDTVGVDATGQKFNSIDAVEQHEGKEMNPLVNPGAITMTSMVRGATAEQVWAQIIGTYNQFAGRILKVDQEVYRSESESNQRNRAIAELMHAYGLIKDKPDQALDLYTRECSVAVNALDLATMAATLANGGTNPRTGQQVIDAKYVAPVLAVMATAGLYDDSGKWLYQTGLPGKSGVGGGLIAASPGKFGIAAVSPPLDEAGNSVRAQKAIAFVGDALGANPFASTPAKRGGEAR